MNTQKNDKPYFITGRCLFFAVVVILALQACENPTDSTDKKETDIKTMALTAIGGLMPSGGILVSDLSPTLSWDAVDYAKGYTLQLAAEAGQIASAPEQKTMANVWAPKENLSEGASYYWRVQAYDDKNTSQWSELGSFTLRRALPLSSAEDLANLEDFSALYRLTQDIDLGGSEWTPLGTDAEPFTGTLDGGGHRITGLYISGTENGGGLFGCIGSDGTVSNIILSEVSISAAGLVGAVSAINRGTVEACSVTGSISGTGSYVGGITGINYGTIQDSDSVVTVRGEGEYTGGITGFNAGGSILNASVEGTVTGQSYTGGAVGKNSYGTIGSIQVSAQSSGTSYVGGIVGDHDNGILTDFSAESVLEVYGSSDYVGGLAGRFTGSTGLAGLTFTVAVSGNNNVGGLLGQYNANYAEVLTGYYTYPTDIQDVSLQGTVVGESYVGGLVGINYHGTLRNCTSAVAVQGNRNGIDENNDIGLIGGLVGGNYGSILDSSATGSVTYTATSKGSMVGGLIGRQSNTSNTDSVGWIISGCSARGTVTSSVERTGGFVGLANLKARIVSSWADGSVNGKDYCGGFVGLNYGGIIEDCYALGDVSSPLNKYVGGFVGQNGVSFLRDESKASVIRNCYAQSSVSGGSWTGGFAGNNYSFGNIEQCSALGEVSLSFYGGGFSGGNFGTLIYCRALGNVTALGNGNGGLVGVDGGLIDRCYARGNVSGTRNLGGLVGFSDQMDISNAYGTLIRDSYARGSVTGTTNIGGLLGGLYDGTTTPILRCYAAGEVRATEAEALMGGLVGLKQYDFHVIEASFYDEITGCDDTGKGTKLSTQDMKSLASFIGAGWDFTEETENGTENIWAVSTLKNDGYPYILNINALP